MKLLEENSICIQILLFKILHHYANLRIEMFDLEIIMFIQRLKKALNLIKMEDSMAPLRRREIIKKDVFPERWVDKMKMECLVPRNKSDWGLIWVLFFLLSICLYIHIA